MKHLYQTIFFFIHLFYLSYAAPSADEVVSMPGFNGPLPSKHYGGYLTAEQGESHLFYLFAESEGDPSTDPLILWLNGGPGCSSLLGYFTEHGPFEVTSGSTLALRNYRWTRLANILYLESPVGVGFSYSDTGNYFHNDTRTMDMNFDALNSFFQKFPEYKTNPFYIMGESYAGVYVPMLAHKVVNTATYAGAPLLGVAVGNGCTGTNAKSTCAFGFACRGAHCPSSNPPMAGACYGFALQTQYLLTYSGVPESLRQTVLKSCNWTVLNDHSNYFLGCGLSTTCFTASNDMLTYFTAVDAYNIYGSCMNPNLTDSGSTSCIQQGANIASGSSSSKTMFAKQFHTFRNAVVATTAKATKVTIEKERNPFFITTMHQNQPNEVMTTATYNDDDTGDTFASSYWNSLGTPAFCFSENSFLSEYVNNEAFVTAVHAIRPSSFCWGGCNQHPNFTYTSTLPNTNVLYTDLLLSSPTTKTQTQPLIVLIYNGDFDSVVPINDNYDWTFSLASSLQLQIVKDWNAWQYTSAKDNSTQVGGYNIKWSNNSGSQNDQNGMFEFRTVRAAGHTVPQDMPDEAFQLFAHFLSQQPGGTNGSTTASKHYYFPPQSNVITSDCDNDDDEKSDYFIGMIVLAVLLVVVLLCVGVIGYYWRMTNSHNNTSNKSPTTGSDGITSTVQMNPIVQP